jgi:hypothetical protein
MSENTLASESRVSEKQKPRKFRLSWKTWLPPLFMTLIILIGLILLAPHGSVPIFHYRIF